MSVLTPMELYRRSVVYTEVVRVGSTSCATVANVSNIDVFEVGANIVLLS